MPKVSIIIVHYKESGVLYSCIRSIYRAKPKCSYEIVVVDNDEVKTITSYIKKNFPKVKYIASPGDLGYGKGNNLGVKYAKGEYILILNPDTIVKKGSLEKLLNFFKKDKKIGIVAPTLYDEKGRQYPLQGTKKLTFLRGIFALSFINKIFPGNPVSKDYWIKDVDRTKPYEVEVVPGSAFMIKRSLYNKVKGFDKNFFLYFEESDFCNRVRKLGYKFFILPDAALTHFWAVSTPPSEFIRKVFAESRFYYFKKNYGLLGALIIEFFARINKWNTTFFAILVIGAFLRFYRIIPNIVFNGEMGTDYMNVWNMIHGTRTWLIGPRTSHEWFFIPPIAYWIYAVLEVLGNYRPPVFNYFWGTIGILSLPVCYYYIQKLFTKTTALISTLFIAVSPMWLDITRAARYNAPAAILFFPYLYYLWESITDKGKSLIKLGLVMGLMMSFFPSPFLLIPAAVVSFIFYKTNPGIKNIFKGILGFLIPNVTFLIYEFTDKFSIIRDTLIWIPYRVLGFFGLYHKNTVSTYILKQNITSIYDFFAKSFFGNTGIFQLIFFATLIVFAIYFLYINFKNRKTEAPFYLLMISLLVSYAGLFVHGDPPEHYYYVIYPVPAILTAFVINKLFKKVSLKILATVTISLFSIYYLYSSKWFYFSKIQSEYNMVTPSYSVITKTVDKILEYSDNKPFSVQRIGFYDQFENNFANNYIYLLKIKGATVTNPVVNTGSEPIFTIVEFNDEKSVPKGNLVWNGDGIKLYKYEKLSDSNSKEK